MKLKASHATRPKVGESVNGDGVVVRQLGDRVLLAVVDALGHGPIAADVKHKACQHLEQVSLELDVRLIIEGLHKSLRGTRGAAAMICGLVIGPNGQLEGCGVGNVDLRAQGANIPIVLSPGVLGAHVRTMRVFRGEVSTGSRLVLFSDGISSRAAFDGLRRLSPAIACEQVLANHSHAHDDATVLIADLEP